MKRINSTALLLMLFCLIAPNIFAQTCSGPNKLKTSNLTAFSVRINWVEGGAIETMNYRPLGTTQWQTFRNVHSPFTLSGLTASTIYEYFVSTECASYLGTPPQNRFTTLASCMPAQNLSAVNIKINSALISWTRGTGISNEVLVYKEVGTTNTTRIITPFGEPSFRLSGLKTNTEYEVVIESDCPINSQPLNNQGTVMSPPFRFRTATQATCDDVGLTIQDATYSGLELSWNPDIANVRGYEVCYRILDSGADYICKTLSKNESRFLISGSPSTTYEILFKTTCTDGTVYERKETALTKELPPLPPCPNVINFNTQNGPPDIVNSLVVVTATWGWSNTSTNIPFTYDLKLDVFQNSINAFRPGAQRLNQPSSKTSAEFGNNYKNFAAIRYNFTIKCADGTTTSSSFVWNSPNPNGTSALISTISRNEGTQAMKIKNYSISEIENLSTTEASMTIASKSENTQLRVSPNPTDGFLTFDLPEEGFEQIQITTLAGQVVKIISLEEGIISQKIDCTNLPNGLYFLSAKGHERQLTQKFIKN